MVKGSCSPGTICEFPGCEKKKLAKGLCSAHWLQQHEGRTLRPLRVGIVGCKEEGCGSKHHAHGYCGRHYAFLKNHLGFVLGTCAFKGCDRPIANQKRGLCNGHSQQWAKGKQLVPLRFISRRLHETGIQKTTSERFDDLVKKMPSGCWEWQGTRTPEGYGHFADGRVSRRHGEPAHRYSWARSQGIELKNLPRKLAVDHLCRNRSCVNPQHLDLVRPGDNTRSMLAWHTLEADVELLREKREKLLKRVAVLRATL